MTYKDLDVYRRSYDLALKIYKLSLELPKELQYDLGDQIRRASRSIPSNIAEGYSRNKSSKDKINFLNDALGSNEEMLFNLEFLRDTNLISEKYFQEFQKEYTICGKQLYKLINTLK
ncbi:MAG: four helix bundle protein [Candidatus Pacebacteria bacterium]|nr:four helix bundle protein [Candidatus Paceibacterota bacterium]